MQRHLACALVLSCAAPLPGLAGDSARLQRGQDATPLIAAAATGALRLIYLQEPPAASQGAAPTAPRETGTPPDRPVIVLADSCHWDDPDAGLGQIRSAFIASAVWLLEPASQDCDPAAISAAFDAASAAPERERLALLLANGLRLSQAEPQPVATATPASGGLFTGRLVISALPVGASLDGGAPVVIEGAGPETITSVALQPLPAQSDRDARQPAVRANPSGRAGLPEPAVVVGELASLLAADKRSATGAPREVRDRIREIDPAFFVTLLDLGSFDPDEGQYVAAIQTELSGMNCYTGTVDGNWGPGSSSAADRYFSELGAARQVQAPGLALYREIATHPGVTCPAPVVTVRTEPPATATRDRGARGNSSGTGTATRRPQGGQQGGQVNVGANVSTGPNVRANGQPVSSSASTGARPAQTNSPPRIDSSLLGVGSGVIK